jgi:hypothetical protein
MLTDLGGLKILGNGNAHVAFSKKPPIERADGSHMSSLGRGRLAAGDPKEEAAEVHAFRRTKADVAQGVSKIRERSRVGAQGVRREAALDPQVVQEPSKKALILFFVCGGHENRRGQSSNSKAGSSSGAFP